jgi:hypothetical protein
VPYFGDPFQEAGSGTGDAKPTRPPCPLFARSVHISGRKPSQEELTRALLRADCFRGAGDNCLPRSSSGRPGRPGRADGSSSSRHPFNGCSSLVGNSVDQQGQTRAVRPGCESSRKRGTAESGNWAEGGVQSGDPWRLSVQWVESRKAASPCHFHFHFHFVAGRFGAARPASCRLPRLSTIPFRGLFLRLLPRIVQSPSIQLPSSVPLWRGRSFVADGNPPISISHPPTP